MNWRYARSLLGVHGETANDVHDYFAKYASMFTQEKCLTRSSMSDAVQSLANMSLALFFFCFLSSEFWSKEARRHYSPRRPLLLLLLLLLAITAWQILLRPAVGSGSGSGGGGSEDADGGMIQVVRCECK